MSVNLMYYGGKFLPWGSNRYVYECDAWHILKYSQPIKNNKINIGTLVQGHGRVFLLTKQNRHL